MARKKIKYNNPDGLFIQHADQIKLLFKNKTNKNKNVHIGCCISHGFFYCLKIFDNEVQEEFVSKLENLSIDKIIQKVGYISASSDRVYLPDISIRLNNQIENILNTFKNYQNLFSSEVIIPEKTKSVEKELRQVKVPSASLFDNLSVIIKELNKKILNILNENFILGIEVQSLDINTIMISDLHKNDKNESFTTIRVTIYPRNNLNVNIYQNTVFLCKLISEITQDDILEYNFVSEIKNILNSLNKRRKITIKKGILKTNTIQGVLFDTTVSSYLISILQKEKKNSFTKFYTDYWENKIERKCINLNNLKTKKVKILNKQSKTKDFSKILISELAKNNVKTFLYIEGLIQNDLNIEIMNNTSSTLTLKPLYAYFVRNEVMELVDIDMVELNGLWDYICLYQLNINPKPLLYFTKEGIIKVI